MIMSLRSTVLGFNDGKIYEYVPLSVSAITEQLLCNGICFVWWLRLSQISLGGENWEVSLACAPQPATLTAV